MSGINVVILRRDFTIAKKKMDSSASHVHYGNGSYLNMENGILATQNYKKPPTVIFQEGNAVPKGVPIANKVLTKKNKAEADDQSQGQSPWENVKWGTWYIPMLRGLNRQHHGRGNLIATFGKIFNLKTLPFWVIGLALLSQFFGEFMALFTPMPVVPPVVPDNIIPPGT